MTTSMMPRPRDSTSEVKDSSMKEIPLSPSPKPNANATTRLLEQRSLEIVESINMRNYDVLYKYVSTTFIESRPHGPGLPGNYDVENSIQLAKDLHEENPECRVWATATLVDINDEDKYATVWVNTLWTGSWNGVEMENVHRFRWRKTIDGWVIINHSLLAPSPKLCGDD